MTELEESAERALRDVESDGTGFARFMTLVENVARSPGNHDEFVSRTACALAAQMRLTTPLGQWAGRIARAIGFGNEDDTIEAVKRRSQLEFARELYRGSAAQGALDDQQDSESDDTLMERAVEFGIDPEPGIPRSHRWWRWPTTE